MIKSLSIFSSSKCNLNCTYCYVKKEKAVFDYDTQVVNAIINNEYIKRFQKDFPEYVDTLETLELWGAEPTIHLDLIADRLKDYKTAFPKLHNFMMSSNYTLPTFINQVEHMLKAMENIKGTEWNFRLQCSIDGTPSITDTNRGIGTTDAILSNLKKLKELKIPSNVNLSVSNKATIDRLSFDNFLHYDFCKEYFDFLNNNISFHCDNKVFRVSAPTCVEPIYYTKEDGIKYAKIIENFIKITEDSGVYFIPYIQKRQYYLSEYVRGGFCSQLHSSMIMLPNGEFTNCHRAGFDTIPEHHEVRAKESLENYNRVLDSSNKWVKDLSGYNLLRANMQSIYDTKSKMLFQEFYNYLKVLLNSGQISSEYLNDEILKKHTKLYLYFTMCMQTNKELTGSFFCGSSYYLPLFFNGAISKLYDYLYKNNLIIEEDC